MSKLSPHKVEAFGPRDAKVMIVGEFPGSAMDDQNQLYVGRDGDLLGRYLARCAMRYSEVYTTHLCKYRPKAGKFEVALGSDELAEGIRELVDDLKEINPNVIIALGGWSLFILTQEKLKTPGSGIGKYRGSILPSVYKREDGTPYKVIPTYTPEYVLRDWGTNAIFLNDLKRAKSDSKFPELRHPEYESYINPSLDHLDTLVSQCLESPWTSIDIETFPGRYSCIGFTNSDKWGATITFQHPQINSAEELVRKLWEADNPKIYQFGTYDTLFMERFYGWKPGGFWDVGWDTFVAGRSLNPEFPQGLDFFCSIYTRFPFYKEERKMWKESGDISTLWEYNVKDVVATHQVAMKQMEEIKELFS